ncbi:MAG: hypothetical protein ABSB53_08685 [Nitrososphaerales archaeon]
MSVDQNFFRHCPSCSRRFEIRLVGKKSVGSKSFADKENHLQVAPPYGARRSPPLTAVLEEGKPFVVDVEKFQYRYRCKHCGHEWSEVRQTERRVESEGYTGD